MIIKHQDGLLPIIAVVFVVCLGLFSVLSCVAAEFNRAKVGVRFAHIFITEAIDINLIRIGSLVCCSGRTSSWPEGCAICREVERLVWELRLWFVGVWLRLLAISWSAETGNTRLKRRWFRLFFCLLLGRWSNTHRRSSLSWTSHQTRPV